MSKLEYINEKAVTPDFVLRAAIEKSSEMKAIYVVGVTKENDVLYFSVGEFPDICIASAFLQKVVQSKFE